MYKDELIEEISNMVEKHILDDFLDNGGMELGDLDNLSIDELKELKEDLRQFKREYGI